MLQNAGLAGSPFVNVKGNQFSRAPKFSAAINAAYTLDLGDDTVTLATDMAYTSRVYFSPFETSYVSQPKYALWNAQLSWDHGPVTLTGFVRNITDKFYKMTAQTFPTAIGTSYLPSEPRSYGVSAKYAF